ncbi:MAG: NAD(P)H-dependent oxidoreductase subunit E [Candidatus Zixiibacteriota bacterium]
MTHDFSKLQQVFERYPRKPQSLIAILQDIQKEYNYLPCDALRETAKALDLPLSKVFSVSTFYNAFSLTPKGDKVIRVCVGTACHIRGAELIQHQLESILNVEAGQTTDDLKYTLEVVSCVGTCAMAPVVIVNDTYCSNVKVGQSKSLLKKG